MLTFNGIEYVIRGTRRCWQRGIYKCCFRLDCTWQHSRLHLGAAVHRDELEQVLGRFRLGLERRVEEGQHRSGQLQNANKQTRDFHN